MKYIPKELEENVNISSVPPLKEFFILLFGILGILVGIYVILGLAVDLIVPTIPPGIEQNLGRFFLEAYETGKKTLPETRFQPLLDDLAKELPQSDVRYKVYLIEHDQSNAIALPGAHIIVFSGILKDLASENGLSFILAHELGHFVNRDHLRGLGRGIILWTFSLALFGNDSCITNFLAHSLVNVEMKFSQHQETMADLFALDLLNKKYGHVGGAEDFLENACKKEKRGRLSYYFASHPHPKDRIRAIEAHIRKKGYLKEMPIPLGSERP